VPLAGKHVSEISGSRIRKQLGNRSVEALRDIETSIALNPSRSIYRSRFLLGEDLSARSTRLALVYRDLGFSQLALVQGWRSIAEGAADPGVHRFLADSYAALPLHQIARDSELLQARLLAPPNLLPYNARRAADRFALFDRYGPFAAGYADYSSLFDRNSGAIDVEVFGGTQSTFGEDSSAAVLHGQVAAAAAQSLQTTEGFRENDDLDQQIESVFAQAEVPWGGLQIELRDTNEHGGDNALLFDPDNYFPTLRRDIDAYEVRLGSRFDVAPGSTGLLSLIAAGFESQQDDNGFTLDNEEDARTLEYRHILDLPLASLNTSRGKF
jgi:hypothetical protein